MKDKTYNITVRNIYTDEQRSLIVTADASKTVQEVHKQAMNDITLEEDILFINYDKQLLYSLNRGFFDR